MRNRIVAVSYLNTIPFIYGIESAADSLPADLILSPPSGCAAALRNREADIALIPVGAIPSIDAIRIITPYCIGAVRSVRTVVLACNDPLETLHTIKLDPHSVTSARLVRILAAQLWHIAPQWQPLANFDELAAPQPHTGYLMIGDKVFDNERHFAHLYDLADAWRTLTSLPFAFAAWVARDNVSEQTEQALSHALEYGIQHIHEAVQHYGYTDKGYAEEYLTHNIDFLFDEQKHRAVERYWQEGMKIEPPINPG